MVKSTRSRPAVKPNRTAAAPQQSAPATPSVPSVPQPPTGSAAWLFRPIGPSGVGCLRITSQTQRGPVTEHYLFQRVPQGFNLTKQDGTAYLIDTFDLERWVCNCADFQKRRASNQQQCKHCAGIRVALSALRQPPVYVAPTSNSSEQQSGRNRQSRAAVVANTTSSGSTN